MWPLKFEVSGQGNITESHKKLSGVSEWFVLDFQIPALLPEAGTVLLPCLTPPRVLWE